MTSPAAADPRMHRVDRLLARWRSDPPTRLPPVLRDDAHVIIVGAGPAGCFAAHFLRRFARERGLRLRMTIFDAKDFSRTGPAGCNMCAGMVTGSLMARMNASGISLPEHVEQARVCGFRLIARRGSVRVREDDPEHEIVTVFRGNGPRLPLGSPLADVSFDDALLRAVSGPDLSVVREPVAAISPSAGSGGAVAVEYGRGKSKGRVDGDAVVGAFGINLRLARQLADAGLHYRPPRIVRACQAELHVGREYIEKALHNEVQVFNLGLPGISFAALIPKGDFLTCTLIGKRDLGLDDLLEFVDQPLVRARLPAHWELPRQLCHCHPGVVVSGAHSPYGERVVMVGDAACCRYYKNGLETAFDSAQIAAFTITHVGVSARAFRSRYAATCDRLVNRDNRYGRVLFAANGLISRSRAASRAFLVLCRAPGAGLVGRRMRDVLWGLFAGDRPYSQILGEVLHPRVIAAASWQVLVHLLRPAPQAAPR